MTEKKPGSKRGRALAGPAPAGDAAIPEICDFDCPHAGFPPAETAGICRTMSAVWCGKLGELVNKNRECEWRRREREQEQKRGRKGRGGRRGARPKS